MVRVRLEVLETISKWLVHGGGTQDALDDSQLYASLSSFLSQPNVPPTPADEGATTGLTVLEDTRKNLLTVFSAQQRRPLTKVGSSSSSSSNRTSSVRKYGSEAPEIDQIEPEDLVSNLDAMASAAFRNVVQEVCVPSFPDDHDTDSSRYTRTFS